jgi:hypothetical protein
LRPILIEPDEAPERLASQEEIADEETDLAKFALTIAPPWLVSAVIHMVAMIVLALWFLPGVIKDRLHLESVWAETLGEQLEFDSSLAGNDKEKVEMPIVTPEDLPLVADPLATPPKIDPRLDLGPSGSVTASRELFSSRPGYALLGREAGSKKALLAAYGGTALTEAAVQAGLKWLSRMQQRDGSWSLKGPYSDGAMGENRAAATAMALLAFQGAGHTHQQGEFKQNVEKGWYWLLKQQDEQGNFFHEGGFNQAFYTQGQCTIALCELYGMTRDEKFKPPAERAVKYCLQSQSSGGGWRYSPGEEGDVSVTGWILMALQSARMAGLAVPAENLKRVEGFLDKMAVKGTSHYLYRKGEESMFPLAMTAEALLCRQYLGWRRYDPRLIEGVERITQPENLINYEGNFNVYFWYYATQVCHHMEGEYWRRWNNVMRQILPEHQIKEGRNAGSWNPRGDQWETYGGRLYVTCLSLYCLEVYYRHLPLYSNPFAYVPAK